jgi:predicted nucleic acid-binding Zn ribbon protein
MSEVRCPVCGRAFPPAGRRRFCSDACRQAAFRRRHPTSQTHAPLLSVVAPKSATVYECPACGVRLLGEQRCADCGVFCRRIGPGGSCPYCDEPVAIADLVTSDTKQRR